MNELMQAVSTLGFPIVMCFILFWYMAKQNETHAEESKSMREAINDLKIAIVKLCDKIGKGDNDNDTRST